MLKRWVSDWIFIAALLAAFFVAWWVPAARNESLHSGLGHGLPWGIMLVFLLQGLSLPGRELVQGLTSFRLHAAIQFCIFALAAFWMLIAATIFYSLGSDDLAAGFVYLALLPTTISSAILFTAATGGNVSLSLVNTSLSNIGAILWVPLGCWLFLQTGGQQGFSGLTALITTLAQWILLPLCLGQVLRSFIINHQFFVYAKPHFKTISSSVILLIVFKAFVELRVGGSWQVLDVALLSVLVFTSLFVVLMTHLSVWWFSRWASPDCYSDRIAILFCGSQKSLATGAPMAVAIFSGTAGAADPRLGLLLLPLLIVHPMQLMLASLLKNRLSG